MEEEEFGADVFLGFFDPGAAGGAGMVEVELVGDDEAGFAFLGDLPGDLAILGGNPAATSTTRRQMSERRMERSARMAEKTSTELSMRERGRRPAVSMSVWSSPMCS